MASKLVKVTATGDVTTKRAYLRSLMFNAPGACTADIREGGSSGTIIATLVLAAAGAYPTWTSGDTEDGVGMRASAAGVNGIHVTLSAAGNLMVEYDEVA